MGAVAITATESKVVGDRRVFRGTGTMSTSYATDGDTFSLTTIGCSRLDYLGVTQQGLGVMLRWDGSQTAPKIMAYRDVTPAANAALVQPAAAQSLAATGVFQYEAWGA